MHHILQVSVAARVVVAAVAVEWGNTSVLRKAWRMYTFCGSKDL